MKITASLAFVILSLVCVGLLPEAHAVSPPPDGGYPGGNTAEGQNALFSLTSGTWNTALGYRALYQNTTGNNNTATGLRALFSNLDGDNNVATGVYALFDNTSGEGNAAHGYQSLANNTIGSFNTASGNFALHRNTIGGNNAAYGDSALANNTGGGANTAIGEDALEANSTGDWNTAVGGGALGGNGTGSFNVALGAQAGLNVTTADNVICVGYGIGGANLSNRCYIGNIYGVTPNAATAVYVNSLGQLGTIVSSRRFKDEITPMDKASEAILALKPVTFRYKKEVDAGRTPQFGLVAEDVEKVNPDLVVRDKEGNPYTVRYEAVNAMLLNEFLKEHKTVQDLKSVVAEQQKQIEALTAGLRKVNVRLGATKPTLQTAAR
jgi:Chaperone of endosialidase